MRWSPFALVIIIAASSCSKGDQDAGTESPYKQAMRAFVIGMSQYARGKDPHFLVIPQNGMELVSSNGDVDGTPHAAYLDAIDANGQEDLFYGYDHDDQATPPTDHEYLRSLIDISRNAGKTVLITDYCATPSKVAQSYLENGNAGYVSFAADRRELNNIPHFPAPINHENNAVITGISQVKNFLYLINPAGFTSKAGFISAVTATNYDLLIMDLFFRDGVAFTSSEVARLKSKANGGRRLVIAYMSVGEAEDYRYYWQASWKAGQPGWLDAENPDWAGNFKVRYWHPEWQHIIYGDDDSYLKKILDAGFDGVYLDIIDAFEHFERQGGR